MCPTSYASHAGEEDSERASDDIACTPPSRRTEVSAVDGTRRRRHEKMIRWGSI